MAQRFRIGELEVLAVADGSVSFPPQSYFANTTEEQWKPHARWMDHEGKLTFPFGCFVVRSGNRRVLIDTGVGPIEFGPFKGGALMDELTANGVEASDIDAVFITHLHLDHCGTAALPDEEGALTPAFPRATYHWTSDEQAHWKAQPASPVVRHDIFAAVAAQFVPSDGGYALAPGIDVIALPGHTPGHAGVVLSSGDQRAFLLGDAIGCPVQLEEPEWSGMGDVDKALARRTQEAVAKEIEGAGALVGGSHFPDLMLGRVLRGEGKRYWQPV